MIDFTENGVGNQGNGLFEACPGGAPCNVPAIRKDAVCSMSEKEEVQAMLAL